LFRGQIQGSNTLEHTTNVELINDEYKYMIQVTRSGPESYFLIMNGSSKEVDFHRMSDQGNLFYNNRGTLF
jgi:acetyl-CoA carboxylase/biotin carboxylase 1